MVVVVEVVVTVEEMMIGAMVKVKYNCHVCHEEMEAKDISPFMEWHICDTCTNKKYENDE